MEVTNAVNPPTEQIQAFFTSPVDGPFVMVNLLKFHEVARYEDDPTIEITGREAYEIYGAEVTALVERLGGRLVYDGEVTGIILGEVEEMWDHVALVEYPSHEAFTAMLMSPEWAAIERHRVAGLAGQLNIRVESKAS